MRPAENIEKLIRDVPIDTSAETDKTVLGDVLKALENTKETTSVKPEPNIWRTIMKSRITRLAAAAVILIAVVAGLHYYAGPIGVTSTAWAELVEKVEQSHEEYMSKLLLAVEDKDTENIEFYADLLDEFWQKLGWLAGAELHPELRDRVSASIAATKAHYEGRQDSDKLGVQLFLDYEDQFNAWLGNIAQVDLAWINETVHVCKQMEEYAEEIRDAGRQSKLGFPYAEHCMPSFVTYCQWFEQLPWDNPHQCMSANTLVGGIRRDLLIARREMETLEIRDVIRFVKRCVQQAQKNALALDGKTASGRTAKQRDLCRDLNRRIDELWALITYAEIARWDFIEKTVGQDKSDRDERYNQVLTKEFGNKGPFAGYYIERINQSLALCDQLSAQLGAER
jgi:hypothetical protein